MNRGPMLAEVAALMRAVARRELLPRFRRLGSSDVEFKSPGEMVTVADRAAEAALARGLLALVPGSLVVGEEGSALDPSLVARIDGEDCAWLVDPLDGTAHFAAGEESWGMMVALVRRGTPAAGWIHLPLEDRMACGAPGEGVHLDGAPVRIPPPPPLEAMRGALMTRFLPPELQAGVEAAGLQRTDSRHQCAAARYIDLLRGVEHFALYHRTLPWDHAPGVLLTEAAGGVARRLDGTPYVPGRPGSGLLVAADMGAWRALHDRLVPGVAVSEGGAGVAG